MKHKKGSITDAILLTLMLIVIAMVMIPLTSVFVSVNSGIQANAEMADESKAMSADYANRLPKIFEGIWLMILIGGFVATFAASFFIDSHPVFFIIGAISFSSMLLVIPFLPDVYNDMAANSGFDNVDGAFVLIPFIMQNYVKVMVLMWAMVLFALYAKVKIRG